MRSPLLLVSALRLSHPARHKVELTSEFRPSTGPASFIKSFPRRTSYFYTPFRLQDEPPWPLEAKARGFTMAGTPPARSSINPTTPLAMAVLPRSALEYLPLPLLIFEPTLRLNFVSSFISFNPSSRPRPNALSNRMNHQYHRCSFF